MCVWGERAVASRFFPTFQVLSNTSVYFLMCFVIHVHSELVSWATDDDAIQPWPHAQGLYCTNDIVWLHGTAMYRHTFQRKRLLLRAASPRALCIRWEHKHFLVNSETSAPLAGALLNLVLYVLTIRQKTHPLKSQQLLDALLWYEWYISYLERKLQHLMKSDYAITVLGVWLKVGSLRNLC